MIPVVKVAMTLLAAVLSLTATSCAAGTATASQGVLILSGAITSTVTVGNQQPGAGCVVVTTKQAPPASTPDEVSLTGTVDLSSASATIALRFMGAPTTLKLPLPGELTVPGPPGFIEVTANGSAEWSAGQSSPTSSGTLTLSRTALGRITGHVVASLAPLRGSATPLHIAGTWSC